MTGTPTKFDLFVQDLCRKVHNLNSDSLKILLLTAAPAGTEHVYADVIANEVANGHGYTTGGIAVGSTSCSATGGVATLVGSNVTITASGGDIGPFRAAALYNDTSASDNLIQFLDYGEDVTIPSGVPFTIRFNQSGSGILQVV